MLSLRKRRTPEQSTRWTDVEVAPKCQEAEKDDTRLCGLSRYKRHGGCGIRTHDLSQVQRMRSDRSREMLLLTSVGVEPELTT